MLDELGHVAGYRRVHVRLFNGYDSRAKGHEPWPAGGGKPPTQWAISRPAHPFEIREYEVA
ncbi:MULTISPECIES: hypothetical protein [unclassified Sphingomonas]|uniref:hypothetical protein n=1 Tax=Novosphingobium rhizosphaerae TaxID=1551649 RepID=UPI0015C99CC3